MDMSKPIVVLFTSHECGSCSKFKGDSFFPSERKPFSPTYIKNLLETQTSKRSNFLIEIVSSKLSNISPIFEINIYLMLPPLQLINKLISNNPKIDISEIENSEFCESLTKICISSKNKNVEVAVNGIYSESLSFLYTEKYIWNVLPDYINELRTKIVSKENIDSILEHIESSYLKKQILNKTQLKNYQDNPDSFDNYIYRNIFSFDYFSSRIIPTYIRVYEPYYPCWVLVSSEEWFKCLNTGTKIYARLINHYTDKTVDGNYVCVKYTSVQTITNLLESYENGELSLSYDPDKKVSKKYSWQT